MCTKFLTTPLNDELHRLSGAFDCGTSKNINSFLRSHKSLDLNYGKTYVMTDQCATAIVGFYTLTTGHVEEGGVKTGGSIHIRDFALDKAYRGRTLTSATEGAPVKLSDILLDDCLRRIEYIRERHVGFSMITLFSTPEGEKLYLRNGFEYADEAMVMAKEEDDGDTKAMYRPVDIVYG